MISWQVSLRRNRAGCNMALAAKCLLGAWHTLSCHTSEGVPFLKQSHHFEVGNARTMNHGASLVSTSLESTIDSGCSRSVGWRSLALGDPESRQLQATTAHRTGVEGWQREQVGLRHPMPQIGTLDLRHHSVATGCQSSTRFPSGSVIQPNFPKS